MSEQTGIGVGSSGVPGIDPLEHVVSKYLKQGTTIEADRHNEGVRNLARGMASRFEDLYSSIRVPVDVEARVRFVEAGLKKHYGAANTEKPETAVGGFDSSYLIVERMSREAYARYQREANKQQG